MKKLIIVSAILLSTAVQAESEIVDPKAIEAGQEAISNSVPTEAGAISEGAVSELVQVNNEANSADLLKTLDTNEDGSISKEEAAASKEVTDNWENLDINKDEQLDSEEFAQMLPSEK
jgi:Ca2+-binding EF-hand superfamily protein